MTRTPRTTVWPALALTLPLLLAVPVGAGAAVAPAASTPQLRTDPAGGGLFLANIDDDSRRCPLRDPHGRKLSYAQLSRCNDASDRVVNGDRDAADLARIHSVPLGGLSTGAVGWVRLAPVSRRHANLFLLEGGEWRHVAGTAKVTAAQLAHGLTLGLEGRDVVRDRSRWDGRAFVTLSVTDRGDTSSDTLTLHEAPVLTTTHLDPVDRLVTTVFTSRQGPALAKGSRRFARRLDSAARAAGHRRVTRLHGGEMFPQDFFEQLTTSIPRPNGAPQTMRVLMQSPQPWREGARELYRRFRGPDSAVLHVPQAPDGSDGIGQTLSSTGNLESIPPYSWKGHDYPHGRVIMGMAPKGGVTLGADPDRDQRPAPAMLKLLRAQGQDPLLLDTGWTFVGHVDESIQFLPADTARGWRVAVADPRAGLRVLRKARREGHGDVPLFSAHDPYTRLTTIEDYLSDPDRVLVQENRIAAEHVERNLHTLAKETGISEADVVRVPALFGSIDLDWGHQPGTPHTSPMTPFLPDAVNGVVLDAGHVIAPTQDGPRVHGRDLFADAVRAAYAGAGLSVTFVPAGLYDRNGGSVHCATNALRSVEAAWWDA